MPESEPAHKSGVEIRFTIPSSSTAAWWQWRRFDTPTEFEVRLEGPTQSLLKGIAVLADKRINLDTVSISQAGHGYLVRFLTGSEEDVRTSLMKADLSFRENKVLVIEIANKPGQWLRVAQKLADAGIEVSHTYRVGEASGNHVYAYGVNDYAKAKQLCRKLGKCAED